MDFYDVCKEGDITKVELMIEKGFDNGLVGACKGGNMQVDLWNWGLMGACKGGHVNIIELLIEKGADDWNMGLWYACFGGHLNIAKLIKKKYFEECLKKNKKPGSLYYPIYEYKQDLKKHYQQCIIILTNKYPTLSDPLNYLTIGYL